MALNRRYGMTQGDVSTSGWPPKLPVEMGLELPFIVIKNMPPESVEASSLDFASIAEPGVAPWASNQYRTVEGHLWN